MNLRNERETLQAYQELTDTHADGTHKKETPTTEPFDTPHPGQSHENINNIGHNGNQESL